MASPKIDTPKAKYRMACLTMNMEDLTRKSGLSRATVYNTINGKNAPSMESLRKLCAALECEPKDILREV